MPGNDRRPEVEVQRRDGFALVAVLWLAGLIAAIAAGFAVSVRVNLLTHAAALHGQQLEAAADGLAHLTAFRLAAEAEAGIPAPGVAKRCRWNAGIAAEVLVQDQFGLIDLNAAPLDLLRRLAAGVGASPGDAETIAAAIGDFRDADHEAAQGGGEPEVYPELDFGPKNAPFEATQEIDQLPGMTETLYRAMLPHVTIYSQRAGFDPAAMTPALKAVLGFSSSGEPPTDLVGLIEVSPKRVYGIDARVATASGNRYRRLAIVALERHPDRPYTIFTWQRGGEFDMGPPVVTACFEAGSALQ